MVSRLHGFRWTACSFQDRKLTVLKKNDSADSSELVP